MLRGMGRRLGRAGWFLAVAALGCTGGQTGEVPLDDSEPQRDYRSHEPDWRHDDDDVLGTPSEMPRAHRVDLSTRSLTPTDADVVRLDGSRLYVAHRATPRLSVFDVSDPTGPKELGRWTLEATPARMHLDQGVLYIVASTYERATNALGGPALRAASVVTALSVSDPARIDRLASKRVLGDLRESRLSGDVLYLVTVEEEACQECSPTPTARVVSLATRDASLEQIDSLQIPFQAGRGLIRTAFGVEHIYLGLAKSASDPAVGQLELVHTADPAGRLQQLGGVPIRGQPDRVRFDEHNGVLRVFSVANRESDDGGQGLHVDSFNLETPSPSRLGGATLDIPWPDGGLRIDGARAYATDGRPGDPVVVIDLRDPAAPRVAAQLDLNGASAHVAPRGERLYTLDYDPTASPDRRLRVSAYDVAAPNEPTLLDRLGLQAVEGPLPAWGGDTGFDVLQEGGLIMVSTANLWREGDRACGTRRTGALHLVDLDGDSLKMRGVIEGLGGVQRIVAQAGYLLGMTDASLQVVDIQDRSAPSVVARVDLGQDVMDVAVVSDTLLRVTSDAGLGAAQLDARPLDRPTATPVATYLDVSEVPSTWDGCDPPGPSLDLSLRRSVSSDVVYVLRLGAIAGEGGGRGLRLVVVGLRNGAPQLLDRIDLEPIPQDGYFTEAVMLEGALLVGRSTRREGRRRYAYDVFDLADPGKPRLAAHLKLPTAIATGWVGNTLAVGNRLLVQHGVEDAGAEEDSEGDAPVRLFVDVIDVSDPDEPVLEAPISVPGRLVHASPSGDRLFTVDRVRGSTKPTPTGCPSWTDYEPYHPQGGLCTWTSRRFNALEVRDGRARLVDSRMLEDEDRRLTHVRVAERRLFYQQVPRMVDTDGLSLEELFFRRDKASLSVIDVAADGSLTQHGPLDLSGPQEYGTIEAALGTRVVLNHAEGVDVIDTEDPASPMIERNALSKECTRPHVQDDAVYCITPEGVEAL